MLIRTQNGLLLNADRFDYFETIWCAPGEMKCVQVCREASDEYAPTVAITDVVQGDCADFVLRVLFEAARMGSPVFDVPKTIAQYEHECANMEAINAEEVPCVCER